MEKNIISYIDRLPAKSVVRGSIGSPLGVIATFALFALCIWMYIWSVISYFKGDYFQSYFQTSSIPNQKFQVPYDLKFAIVFYNKTSNLIANHTALLDIIRVRAFQTSGGTNNQYYQNMTSCTPNYFADAINPITMTECYTFPQNSQFDLQFISNVYSTVGASLTYTCLNPFVCKSGTTAYTNFISNFSNTFLNYSFTLYFSTRILQRDGSFQHQVYSISSSQWNTPYTFSSAFDAQLQITTTTIDDSIMPWWNKKVISSLAWFGVVKGIPKNSTTVVSPVPKVDVTTINFQDKIYRYYKKIDWLLGIIGGGMFLFFLVLWIPCNFINQSLQHMNYAEQLLVDTPSNILPISVMDLKPVKMSVWYLVERLLPNMNNKYVREVNEMVDIARMIKKLKIAESNLSKLNIQLDYKLKYLDIELIKQKINWAVLQHSQANGLNVNQIKEQNDQSNLKINQSGVLNEEQVISHIQIQDGGNQIRQSHQKFNAPIKQSQQNKQPNIQAISDIPPGLQHSTIPDDIPKHIDNWSESVRSIRRQQEDTSQIPIQQKQEQILNVSKEIIEALRKSEQTHNLFGVHPTFKLLHQQTANQFGQIVQQQNYDKFNPPNKMSRCQHIKNALIDGFRMLDFFGVKPHFSTQMFNTSCFGCLVTLVILAAAVVTFSMTLANANNYQVIVSKQFQSPQSIHYTLTTGVGFRPALCFANSGAFSYLYGSSKNVQLQFYSYSAALGTTIIPSSQMNSNQGYLLGINSSTSYSSINTSLCIRMDDGYTIPMGGFNTPKQAYFGFNITGYCTGTASYCDSVKATTNANVISFINSYPFTMYVPINQFDDNTMSIYSGGVMPVALRQGTTNFGTTNGVQETLYMDQTQLIDKYTQNFVGDQYPVLQQSLTSNRYQPNQVTRGVLGTSPYYDFRIRPSGTLIRVILKGYTFDLLLGIIGGCFFLYYCVFHLLGKVYNAFNVRAKLAEQLYNENSYQNNCIFKCLHLCKLPLKCICGQYRKDLQRMRVADDRIKQDLSCLQLVKYTDNCYRLSTAGFQTQQQKYLNLTFFKTRIDQSQFIMEVKNKIQVKSDQHFVQDIYDQDQVDSSVQATTNKITNQALPVLNHQDHEDLKDSKRLQNIGNQIDPELQELIPPFQKYIGASSKSKSKCSEILSYFDFFHSNSQFSLAGQWRIRSVFGAILSLAVIGIALALYVYMVDVYVNNKNYLISYQKDMSTNVTNEEKIILNHNNFRLAVGFYKKPNFNFVNVTSLVNSTSTVGIAVFVNNLKWQGTTLITTQTRYDMIPCPINYFTNFVSPNADPAYFNEITSGFCIPTNLSLNLTGINTNSMQFFKVSIYNKTTSTTTLQTLTNTYVVGYMMSVPVIDLKTKSFIYNSQIIRETADVTSKGFDFNISLTKQQITYTKANYTANANSTTISTYNYLQNRVNDRSFQTYSTTVPRTVNMTFSYSGLTQKYIFTQSHVGELIGIAGGIIVVLITVAGCIAGSFNSYKMRYIVGQQLYMFWPTKKQQIIKKQKKNKKGKKIEERQPSAQQKQKQKHQLQLLMKQINNYSEAQLFYAWLLSIPSGLVNRYDWNNTLRRVSLIQKRVSEDLDLFKFYKKLYIIKDTIACNHTICNHLGVPVTRIYAKHIVPQQEQTCQIGINSQSPIWKKLKKASERHQLSSYDNNKIVLALSANVSFEHILHQIKDEDKSNEGSIKDLREEEHQVMIKEKQSQADQIIPPPIYRQTQQTNQNYKLKEQLQITEQKRQQAFKGFQMLNDNNEQKPKLQKNINEMNKQGPVQLQGNNIHKQHIHQIMDGGFEQVSDDEDVSSQN